MDLTSFCLNNRLNALVSLASIALIGNTITAYPTTSLIHTY